MFKIKQLIPFVFMLILSVSTVNAEETSANNTLKQEYSDMLQKSSVYQTFRVVPIQKLQQFQKNLNANLANSEKEVVKLNETIQHKALSIEELQNKTDSLNTELETLNTAIDSMDLMGLQVSKAKYNSIMWTMIFALLALSTLLFIIFKRSHAVTSSTKTRLSEIQEEFEQHRRSALEREQKLARKLHTELHKNR